MTASDERSRPPVGILGLGAYTPDRVMANAEWAEYVDTTDEWIRTRTGIERRRIAAPAEVAATPPDTSRHTSDDLWLATAGGRCMQTLEDPWSE